MELSKEYKISVFFLFNFDKCAQEVNEEKMVISTNVVGEIGYPWEKKQSKQTKRH